MQFFINNNNNDRIFTDYITVDLVSFNQYLWSTCEWLQTKTSLGLDLMWSGTSGMDLS